VKLGKGDATTTEKIMLTLPSTWLPKLEALKTVYGAMSIQDVIRGILGGVLAEKEETQ